MSRVIILGDSHAGSIRRALLDNPESDIASRNVAAGRITDEFLVRTYAGEVAVNPVILAALHDFKLYNPWHGKFNQSDAKVVFLLGSAESHRFAMHRDWMSCGIEGEDTDLPLIPQAMIRDAIGVRLKLLFEGLEKIRDDAPWKIALMVGPPPHRDSAYIEQKRPEWQGIVPPAPRRAKIWAAIRETLNSFAASAGIPIHDFADQVSDADGFLMARYQSDGVHGNTAYGAKMADLIRTAYA